VVVINKIDIPAVRDQLGSLRKKISSLAGHTRVGSYLWNMSDDDDDRDQDIDFVVLMMMMMMMILIVMTITAIVM
jgi:hypothetical protein